MENMVYIHRPVLHMDGPHTVGKINVDLEFKSKSLFNKIMRLFSLVYKFCFYHVYH